MSIIQAAQIMELHPDHTRLPHEDRYEDGAAFSNGMYSPLKEATVPLWDLGFAHADAAYDVVSVSRSNYFRLDDHLGRFAQACEAFQLRNPYSRHETVEILTNRIRMAGLCDSYVWFAVTRGGLEERRLHAEDYQNRFYAYASPYYFIAGDEIRNRGINLLVSKRYVRIPRESVDPRAKNFHWMDLKLSLFEARESNADWSVLCDQNGNLTEAPGSNIFLIKDRKVYTPDDGCLEGITRQTTMEIARELGLDLQVCTVPVEMLYAADEAFITSTAGGIMPVAAVDDKPLGHADRPIVSKIHDLYWTKRWNGWHGTPV